MAIRNIDDYIAAQDESLQPVLQKIRQTIRAAAPDAVEKIAYGMPTFWQETNLIHFAAFKNHIGIYPGGQATSVFAEQLHNYQTSKGTIQFPSHSEIDYQLITDIVHWRLGHMRS